MRNYLLACALILSVGLNHLQADSVGVPRKEDVPRLLKMLQAARSPKDRAFAADQLGKRGQVHVQDVKAAIEPLLSTMKSDNDPNVRRAAVAALGNIGTEPKVVIPALMDALKDKSIKVNLAAVGALGQYGMQARGAVSALREFAKTRKKDKMIMRTVNQTIKQINARVQ